MTVGYRFWVVRPGEDLLLSPYVAPPVDGINVLQASEISLGIVVREDYGPAWFSAKMAATCSTSPDHRPPAPAVRAVFLRSVPPSTSAFGRSDTRAVLTRI